MVNAEIENAGRFEIEDGTLVKYRGCDGTVVIPDGVTAIGDGAFCYFKSLVEVVIPSSVASIGDRAFEGCSALTEIVVPRGVTRIEVGAFGNCAALASVTIPKSVEYIGENAFSGCVALSDVYYGGSKRAWQKLSNGIFGNTEIECRVHFNN